MPPEHPFIKINILFSLHVPVTLIIVGWTCAVENRCHTIVVCNHCVSHELSSELACEQEANGIDYGFIKVAH